jgi:hypothetical protein
LLKKWYISNKKDGISIGHPAIDLMSFRKQGVEYLLSRA